MSIKAKIDLTFWARECLRHPEKAVLPQMAIKCAELAENIAVSPGKPATPKYTLHGKLYMTVHDFR